MLLSGALAGLGVGPLNPLISTALLRGTPAAIRGRVLSAFNALALVATPLAVLLAGAAIELAGTRAVMICLAAMFALLALPYLLAPAHEAVRAARPPRPPTGNPPDDLDVPMSMNAASRRKTLLARHRYSLAAACALALAALAALALRAAPAAVAETPQAAPALRVTTVVAGPGTVPIRIAVSGSLVGRDEIAIRTPLQDQRIAAVLVEEGDWVRAGQPLATLETDTLDAQLRQAQATLGRARAQVQQQEALNAEAQTQLRRIAPLVRSGSVSAQQIDQQQAQARSSAAALAAARAEQEQARAGVAQAQAQRDKAALLAPADGIVSERHARAGAWAATRRCSS